MSLELRDAERLCEMVCGEKDKYAVVSGRLEPFREQAWNAASRAGRSRPHRPSRSSQQRLIGIEHDPSCSEWRGQMKVGFRTVGEYLA
jgi:hypothetical protein